MSASFTNKPNQNNFRVLDAVETVSVFGSITGTIVSIIISNQVAFAAVPLSLSVALNLVNHKRRLAAINHNQQVASAQLIEENIATQEQLQILTQQLAEVRQLTTNLEQVASNLPDHTEIIQSQQTAIAQLTQENTVSQTKLVSLTQQLFEVKRLTNNLNSVTSNLQNHTQNLSKEQTKIANTVSCWREIEVCNQNLRIASDRAQPYYNRGVIYQNLGYKQAAIWDHTEAIRLNPNYAKAYQDRGLARAYLGDKRGAIEDLRTAAKLFFEAGDITNYQLAKRDFNKQFPQLNPEPQVPASTAVECLFS